VCLAWVFFRAPTFDLAQAYLGTLIAGGTATGTTVTPLVVVMLVVGMLTQVVPNDWLERLEDFYDRASIAVKVAVPSAVISLVAVASPGGVPPFIYFQF